MAVAVFRTPNIDGEVVASDSPKGLRLVATFATMPTGMHGFHIHKAGDLRGEGCKGLCEHYDIGHHSHGGPPTSKQPRHTGDLGNIEWKGKKIRKTYTLRGVKARQLWGRSIILHEGKDDLGRGHAEDSHTTGHSGARMGCAIFGRMHLTRKRREWARGEAV